MGGAIGAIASAKAASKQMAFQKEAYRHRYQWTMQDMKAAGLNPMLAYQTGVGGASPQGAALGANLSGTVESARQASTAYANYKTAQHGVTTAEGNARTSQATASIREAELVGARIEADIDRTAAGRQSREAKRTPSGIFPATAYGAKRILDRFDPFSKVKIPKRRTKRAYPKYKRGYGKNQDIFGRY